MKFYGRGVVWNPSGNKALCEFTKAGSLETDDPKIIETLQKLGYPTKGKEEFIAGGRIKVDIQNAKEEVAPGVTIGDAVKASEKTKKKIKKRLTKK